MLQFRNDTQFTTALTVFPDVDGIDTLFAIVKGTFSLSDDGTRLRLAGEQVPVTLSPTFNGDPATASIAVPSDMSLMKPSTDVIVLGDACAPHGRPTRAMDVSITVGPVRHAARVAGNRVWVSNGISYRPTDAEPFLTMPLIWERAFGGRDKAHDGPREDARNPSGTGFRAKDGQEPVDGMALPNIEDPRDLLTSWKQRAQPVCFAPVSPHWEPRRSYAGSYDERWQSQRAPYLPDDFDRRFLQIAPPALVSPSPMRGGEHVELVGFHADGPIRFALPTTRPHLNVRASGGAEDIDVMLDTVILEPTARRLQLVWRGSYPCDKKLLKIREVAATLAGAA